MVKDCIQAINIIIKSTLNTLNASFQMTKTLTWCEGMLKHQEDVNLKMIKFLKNIISSSYIVTYKELQKLGELSTTQFYSGLKMERWQTF